MARHWSVFCSGVTERQGMALDRMARKHGIGDGMDLLMKLTGYSRSKVGKMDRASLRPYLDDAFEQYGGEPAPAAPKDELTAAVEAGLARVNGEAVAEPAHLPHLRVMGGIVGLLRGHADMMDAGTEATAGAPETLRRLAEKLEQCHAELWRLLVPQD